jgi:hypothetical protein
LTKNIKRGKLFFSIEFNTRRLKSLIEIYDLFFLDDSKKIIKVELFDYLNYISIAY